MDFNKVFKVAEIAEILGRRFTGNPGLEITGINEIHKVRPGDITFVDIEKYYKKAIYSKASLIIINNEVDIPENKALIISENPYEDYKKLVLMFRKEERIPAEGFYCHPDSEIGEGTILYPQCFISHDVKIGRNCVIHPNAVIHAGTVIGDRVILKANCVIGGDAFYYRKLSDGWEKWPSCGRTIIGDDVHIGSGTMVDRGVSGDTIIGRQTKIDNLCQIGHGAEIGERCVIAGQVAIAGKVIIEEGVRIWGQSGVIQSVRVGKEAEILARSLVTKSLPGGTTYYGNPAREVRQALKEIAYLKNLPELIELLRR